MMIKTPNVVKIAFLGSDDTNFCARGWGVAFVREFWSFTWTSSSSRAVVCCQGWCSPFLSLPFSLSPPLGIYFCDYPDCLRTLLLFHSFGFGFGFSFVIAHRQGKREEGRGERTVNRTKDESENKTKYFSKDLGNKRERKRESLLGFQVITCCSICSKVSIHR